MITVVRHGVANYVSGGLTPAGAKAVESFALTLTEKGYRRIISSPVQRAEETARIIGQTLGIQARTDERLREIDIEGPGVGELFAAFSRESVPGGPAAPRAAFAYEPTRKQLEHDSYKLLAWLRTLGNVLVVTHGVNLTGLKLAMAGKRNWGPEDWRGNGFNNLETLEI